MTGRDKRNPEPTSEITSKVMRANKRKDTVPELKLRRALREKGHDGYRLHWNKVPGRPDIANPGRKIAIFVNGCFWHRCPHCNPPLPKSHTEFWKKKFERNIERDSRKKKELLDNGWLVVTFWECEINNNLSRVVTDIIDIIESRDRQAY